MPDDTNNPSWFPGWLPDFFPRNTPPLHDQVQCPRGQHRAFNRFGGTTCVPDQVGSEAGHVSEVDAFVAPVLVPRPVTPRTLPPKLPPGTAPTQPTPTPGASPVDRTTGRYFGRGVRVGPGVLAAVRNLSVAGSLSYLWFLAFAPSLGYGWRERSLFDPLPRNAGPPRRRRPGATATADEFPFGEDPFAPYRPMPRMPGTGLPIPQRRSVPDAPTGLPDFRPALPRTVPTRPRPMPTPSPAVRSVPAPAPAGWLEPFPGPGYDPFTYAPPTPRARPAPRATPRSTPVELPFYIGDPFGSPGLAPRSVPSPLTRQPVPRAPPPRTAPPRGQPPGTRTPVLTPLNDPMPVSQPQYANDPCRAAANTAQREKRQRRKQCKKFRTVTREVRICED